MAKDIGGSAKYLQVQFLSSAGASVVSALLLNPLDVIKTRMQSDVAPEVKFEAATRGVCSYFPKYSTAAGVQKVTSASLSHVSVVDRLCYLCGKELQPAGMPINTLEWRRQRTLSTTVCLGVEPAGGPRSIMGLVREIVKYEGIGALWKGTGPSLAMAIPQVGIYLTLYDRLKSEALLNGHSLSTSSAWAGAVARSASTTVTSPLELVRTRLQANMAVWGHGVHAECDASARKTSGWVKIASRALSQAGGITALWQGLGPTLWRDVPFSAIYWLVAEQTRNFIANGPSSGRQQQHGGKGGEVGGVVVESSLKANIVAGVVGGTAASLCTHPFDVIKTASQIRGEGESGGTFQLGTRLVRERGAGHLFRGIVPRLFKVAPSCAIVLATYETLKSILS